MALLPSFSNAGSLRIFLVWTDCCNSRDTVLCRAPWQDAAEERSSDAALGAGFRPEAMEIKVSPHEQEAHFANPQRTSQHLTVISC